MAKAAGSKTVQCYHCRQQFDVGARAMTVACAKCGQRVIVHDLEVKNAQGVTKLRTCGKIIVERKGKIIAQLVEAHQGIEVHGTVDAKRVCVRGGVLMGAKATWRGDLRTERVHIETGAKIQGGRFEIATNASAADLGLEDLPGVEGEPLPPLNGTAEKQSIGQRAAAARASRAAAKAAAASAKAEAKANAAPGTKADAARSASTATASKKTASKKKVAKKKVAKTTKKKAKKKVVRKKKTGGS